eukprot:TRINITY_DN8858_c0_g1_i1.p1 TRINITY_DN8858_c0_g1~~TRINITY_DN8858_c0_g1_i1.p1  ORF type:complete len:206 (+),score=17.20 TRINITY_DN8858_c0_g1_i1:45-662(+)
MAREVRRVRLGVHEIISITITEESEEEETPLTTEEQQALWEYEEQASQEREEDRGLSTRQHALLALGRAAQCRACVEAYLQEPSLPQLADRISQTDVPREDCQHSPVPPPDRLRCPAPKGRQRRMNVKVNSLWPHLPEVFAQQVRRPAPKARQHLHIETADTAAEVMRLDEDTQMNQFHVSQDRSINLPTISLARGDADIIALSR